MPRRIYAGLALIAIAFWGCSPAVSEKNDLAAGTATTLGGDAKIGAGIFKNNCSACHGATGVEGAAIGPSLRNENLRLDFDATVSWIKDPQPPMPKLYPQVLSDEQVRDVAAYVQTL